MLTPTIVDISAFRYPIGNTPAVCLTRDVPREKDADILLLGCGDARNILFTSYSDHGIGQLTPVYSVTLRELMQRRWS